MSERATGLGQQLAYYLDQAGISVSISPRQAVLYAAQICWAARMAKLSLNPQAETGPLEQAAEALDGLLEELSR